MPGCGFRRVSDSSARSTPSSRRVSASALRPVADTVVMTSAARAGEVDTTAAAPSASAIITVRWCATTSCSSRAIRARSSRTGELDLLIPLALDSVGALMQLGQQRGPGPRVHTEHPSGRRHAGQKDEREQPAVTPREPRGGHSQTGLQRHGGRRGGSRRPQRGDCVERHEQRQARHQAHADPPLNEGDREHQPEHDDRVPAAHQERCGEEERQDDACRDGLVGPEESGYRQRDQRQRWEPLEQAQPAEVQSPSRQARHERHGHLSNPAGDAPTMLPMMFSVGCPGSEIRGSHLFLRVAPYASACFMRNAAAATAAAAQAQRTAKPASGLRCVPVAWVQNALARRSRAGTGRCGQTSCSGAGSSAAG